jgi:predicted NAD/FAD-binding protein
MKNYTRLQNLVQIHGSCLLFSPPLWAHILYWEARGEQQRLTAALRGRVELCG